MFTTCYLLMQQQLFVHKIDDSAHACVTCARGMLPRPFIVLNKAHTMSKGKMKGKGRGGLSEKKKMTQEKEVLRS